MGYSSYLQTKNLRHSSITLACFLGYNGSFHNKEANMGIIVRTLAYDNLMLKICTRLYKEVEE